MVKAPKLKKETVMEWTDETIKWLRNKFDKIARNRLKDREYSDPKLGISISKYCGRVEIAIDLYNDSKITINDIIDAIANTKILGVVNELREIYRLVKEDIKRIYEWRNRQIERILTDKELEGLPELKSPEILDEYLRGD